MSGFIKSHPTASVAAQALRRSEELRAGGVQTPAARPGRVPEELAFDRVEGETGFDLLAMDLKELLKPLVRLHATPLDGLGSFDPLLRIRPRLSLSNVDEIHQVLKQPVPRGSSVLHGDLHVGQFIRDRTGRVWIVDLDDLAIGPAEADIANFTAHCATSVMIAGGIGDWAGRVTSAWRQLVQPLDIGVFDRFLRFALVRRHLKLRENNRPDFEAEILAYLRGSSSFSMR